MPKRDRKRITYYRGTRRCGHGNIKNRRGAGNRGGRGNAGLKKHKFTYITSNMPNYFLKRGFVRHGVRKSMPVINLYEIDKRIKSSDTKEFVFEGKILGAGVFNYPVSIKAYAWSKKAEEKIKAAGGSISKIE